MARAPRQESRAPGPCPSCAAEEALPIVYGMPDAEDFRRLQGQVVFAGCCVPEVLHRWSCAP